MEASLLMSCTVSSPSLFFRGCSLSPDGLCLLSSVISRSTSGPSEASSNIISQYDVASSSSNILPLLTTRSPSSITPNASLKWYPLMNSANPPTCLHLLTSAFTSIKLIDAYTGLPLHAHSFKHFPERQSDDLITPTVAEFHPDGSRLFCGFRSGGLRVVDLNRIGDEESDGVFNLRQNGGGGKGGKRKRKRKGGNGDVGGANHQKGILSAFAFNALNGNNLFAVGTYEGSIYLYDDRVKNGGAGEAVVSIGGGGVHVNKYVKQRSGGEQIVEEDTGDIGDIFARRQRDLHRQEVDNLTRSRKGITQLSFAPATVSGGFGLLSSSRCSDNVVLWDVRSTSETARLFRRPGNTNLRLDFGVNEEDNSLYCGCDDGCVRKYGLAEDAGKGDIFKVGEEPVNGLSIVGGKMAVAMGGRWQLGFDMSDSDDSDSDSDSCDDARNTDDKFLETKGDAERTNGRQSKLSKMEVFEI